MQILNKFIKKKKTMKAIQYNVENLNDVINLVGSENVLWCPLTQELWIITEVGQSLVRDGYYIVKKQDKKGYPLPERLFNKIYIEEVVSESDVAWTNIRKRYASNDIQW